MKNSCLDLFLFIYSDSIHECCLDCLLFIVDIYLPVRYLFLYLSIHLVELDNIQREVLREAQGSFWLVRTFECVEFAQIIVLVSIVSLTLEDPSIGIAERTVSVLLPEHAKSGTRPELMQIILNIS